MGPKGKKGSKKGEQSPAGSSQKGGPPKKSQDKKASKKEADKKVNDGVKFIEKAEEEACTTRKKKYVEQARALFQSALSLMDSHADALYNLAVADLELVYDGCSEGSLSEENCVQQLASPCSNLSSVIANDTSRRGETTGLAHRILANVSCRYHQAVMTKDHTSFDNLVVKIKSHISSSVTILANRPDLDALLFESCQLFHGMMSTHIQQQQEAEQNCNMSEVVSTSANITFLREQLDYCLQTPQSSGIDLDVKMLEGAVLVDAMSYFVAVLAKDEQDLTQEEVMLHNAPFCECALECVAASLQLHDALVSFVPEDADVQTMAGDLVQGALELHDSFSAARARSTTPTHFPPTSVFRAETKSSRGLDLDLDVQSWLTRLVICRCVVSAQEPSANSWLALGDDLKAIADMIESENSPGTKSSDLVRDLLELLSIAEMGDSGVHVLLERQRQCQQQKRSADAKLVMTGSNSDFSLKDESAVVYQSARKCYESALVSYHANACQDALKTSDDTDDEVDEPDNAAAIHYNLLCVLWKLRDSEIHGSASDDSSCSAHEHTKRCRDHLSKYLELEIETENLDEEEECQASAAGCDVVVNLLKDVDLRGINECEWFTDVLSKYDLNITDGVVQVPQSST